MQTVHLFAARNMIVCLAKKCNFNEFSNISHSMARNLAEIKISDGKSAEEEEGQREKEREKEKERQREPR